MRKGQTPLTMYLPTRLYERLRRTAFAERTSMAAIVRKAVGRELARKRGRSRREAKRHGVVANKPG